MGIARRYLSSSYAKILFAGIVILCCVAGGIYIGSSIVEKSPSPVPDPSFAPAIALGDLFPLVGYTDRGGRSGSFESLVMGHKTLLLFLSSNCGRCEDLLDYWNLNLAPKLDSGVQVVYCFWDSSVPANLTRLIGNGPILIPDNGVYDIISLKITPTIIGVDEYGLVVYIQPGYTEFFGREFYEHFAMTAR